MLTSNLTFFFCFFRISPYFGEIKVFQCVFQVYRIRDFLSSKFLIVVFQFLRPIYRIRKCQNQSREYLQFLIIIQNYTMKVETEGSSFSAKSKFKAFTHQTQSKVSHQLLDHIKDEQFYSSLTTIALQLAKQSGVQANMLDQLAQCFRKVKGISNEGMLKQKCQIQDDHEKQNFVDQESYNTYEKSIPFKQQLSLLQKMEHKLLSQRQKQSYSQALKKFAEQKYKQSLPILNNEPETKTKRFKNIVKRKNKTNLNTSENIFKKGSFDILNNNFEESNQCYKIMRSFSHLKTMFGHANDQDRQNASPIFNVLFDQSQKFIISGAQQGNIKIWSRETGLLLSSLRGHTTYINKLQISKCNKYLFSAAGDGVRFFDLKQMTSLGGWETESIIDIVNFIDKDNFNKFIFCDKKNLYLLDELTLLRNKDKRMNADDFEVFHFRNRLYKESFVWNIQISSDHKKILLGFETGQIILFHYEDLFCEIPNINQKSLGHKFQLPIKHILTHHKDEIRQLKWHINNENFVSGGKQGYCVLWENKNQNTPPVILRQIQVSRNFNRRKKRAFGCNYIIWNCTYTHFIAGFMELMDDDDQDRGNGEIIVYSIQDKEVVCEFSRDKAMRVASVRGLDAHPYYPNIVVICEGTGRILLFDFILKTVVNLFQLRGFHLLHPQYSLTPADCRFTKDGLAFAVSTQSGTVSLFGYNIKSFYGLCPTQQFYLTDFTPFTLDSQTMRAIPVQSDFPVDINRIQRGQICNIRGQAHQNQLYSNPQNYWKSVSITTQRKENCNIQHYNKLNLKQLRQQNNYKKYLKCVQNNLKQDQKFHEFYHKNIEELQQTKQSILYDERLHKSNHFKKLIDDKYRKLKGLPSTQNSNNQKIVSENSKFEQSLNRSRRGRRLMKQSDRMQQQRNHPNYRQDFQWDSSKQEDYVANEEIQEEDNEDLEYDGSDSIPRNTRRRVDQNYGRSRYNIRERQNRSYNQYEEQEDSYEQKRQTRANFKRKSPSELIAELSNDQYQNYQRQPRKRVKRNEFIHDHNDSQQVNSQSVSQQRRRLRRHNTRRGDSDPLSHNIQKYQTRNYEKSSNEKVIKKSKYGQCQRCYQQDATVRCSICKQCNFCDKCKLKRGKQSNSQYKCFICIFLNSVGSALLDQKKLTQSYFRLEERSSNIYVPQIDDEVRYFFQGYEQFLYQNIKILNREVAEQSQEYRLVPHLYNQQLSNTPLCKVTDIKYYFPFKQNDGPHHSRNRMRNNEQYNDKKHIHMLIKLQITQKEKIQKLTEDQSTYFWVFYIPAPRGEVIPFILREQVFQYILSQNVIQNIKVNDVFEFNKQEYQVVEVGPFQLLHPQSIWKYLNLAKCQGKRLRGTSKEEQKRYNIWQLLNYVPQIDYTSNFNQKHKNKIIEAIKNCETNPKQRQYFQNFVDISEYPAYRMAVEVGICLNIIKSRVINGYYKSQKGFEFEVDLIVKNSQAFNGDSMITNLAKEIRKKLLKAIGKDSKELSNSKKNEEKQTTSKKQYQENKQTKQIRQTRSRKKQNFQNYQNYDQEPQISIRSQKNRDKPNNESKTNNGQVGHNLRPTRNRKLEMDSDFQYDNGIVQEQAASSVSSEQVIQVTNKRRAPQRETRLNKSLNQNGPTRRSNRFANERSYESSQKMVSEDNNNNSNSRPVRTTRSRAK